MPQSRIISKIVRRCGINGGQVPPWRLSVVSGKSQPYLV